MGFAQHASHTLSQSVLGRVTPQSKAILLLFDNHVIDRPNWTQVCVKDTDARAWFDRGRYRSSKLIIDKPGPG
jgi:hypothetical protein